MQIKPQLSTTPPLPGVVAVPTINDAFQTVATDFSGDTDPAALAWPYSKWADTSSGILYRRNAAGTAWVEIGRVLERPLFLSDGESGVLPTGGFRNKLVNGRLAINQRVVSGTVTLSAGTYGHDRFKAGSGGCTYTFATSDGFTTLTITAGTLLQVVEGGAFIGGQHVLSWKGTATGRINAGAFQASPVVAALPGGVDATVEFGIGTLSLPQLESGVTPTLFEARPVSDEFALARRYFRRIRFTANDWFTAHTPTGGGARLSFNIGGPMRVAAASTAIDALNWEAYVGGVWTATPISGASLSSGEILNIGWAMPSGAPANGSILIRTTFGCNVTFNAEI